MASIEPIAAPDPKAEPRLTLNLSSNNPFLNPRTGSPALGPTSPNALQLPSPQGTQARHSTNPFLSAFEQEVDGARTKPPLAAAMEAPQAARPLTPQIGDDAKELFKRLTVTDSGPEARKDVSSRSGPMDPPRGSISGGRPPRPEEGAFRRGPNGLRIPVRPPRNNGPQPDRPKNGDSPERRRTRRSSEASVSERAPMTEEDRIRRERRRREREARKRDSSLDIKSHDRDSGAPRSSRRKKPHYDMVDQLDVTGLYGVSGIMHHDGPFDACRPDRNRKKDVLAPMSAFPANSANNTIGGSGPLNKGINLEQFHGVGTEGFHDYATSGKPSHAMQLTAFNPTNRVEPIHGEETMGLGTSTFLEGAPASRKDIQRTESESHNVEGLTRKKSLAQRIRGYSQPRPRYQDAPLPTRRSQEERFQDRSGGVTLMDGPLISPELPRPMTAGKAETNPFDSQEDPAKEKKRASVNTTETGGEPSESRSRALSSPRRKPLERRITEGNTVTSGETKPTGFLSRVKSLKGPRRIISERQAS